MKQASADSTPCTLSVLSNDSPETASRPFDNDRDGFVLGEGAAGIILEEYEHAVKRGAKIYAEIAGGGMSADAHHILRPHIRMAWEQRLLWRMPFLMLVLSPADQVDYINVHGTSTPSR